MFDRDANDPRSRAGSDQPGFVPDTDPELVEDLGPEFELRGDVMEAEIGATSAELDAATAQCAELKDQLLRSRAEMDNYRKRVQRDQAEAVARASERVVTELLPALDNLERAIEHVTAGGDLSHLLGGVEAVHRQIIDIFAKEGAAPVDPIGQAFDPNVHQAVGQKEDPEVADGTVAEVYQKGYQMHGRTIRPAMVVVATGGPPAAKE